MLDVRVFDEATKNAVYSKQTEESKTKGKSNCPLCAIGHAANNNKIWKLKEMDADHISAWSKGGATDTNNCQMLCKTHNRAKGNRYFYLSKCNRLGIKPLSARLQVRILSGPIKK